MPVAFVLSGGGAKGAFEVGVLQYLYNVQRIRPDIVCGTSVGALNAAKLAEGPEAFEDLRRVWLNIRGSHDIYVDNPRIDSAIDQLKGRFWALAVEAVGSLLTFGGPSFLFDDVEDVFGGIESIYVTDPLRQLVEQSLDVAAVEQSGIKLRTTTVDLSTGVLYNIDSHGHAYPVDVDRGVLDTARRTTHEWTRDRREEFRSILGSLDRAAWHLSRTEPIPIGLIDGVIASSSIPVIFNPVRVDEGLFVDGGIREIAPLQSALDLGATEIYVILAGSRQLPELPVDSQSDGFALARIFSRSLNVLLHETSENDLAIEIPQGVSVTTLSPKIGIQDSLDFGRHIIRLNYWYGFNTAKNAFESDVAEPTTVCLYALKLLANKLDAVDSVKHQRQKLLEQAQRAENAARELDENDTSLVARMRRERPQMLHEAAQNQERYASALENEAAEA